MKLQELARNGVFCDGDWIEKKDQDPNGAVRLIQLADIGVCEFKNKSSRYLTAEKTMELHCTYLEKGDILIARLPEPLGRACIFPLEGKYITAVDVAILRPGRDDVSQKYLMYMINSPQFREEIKKYETGTTRRRISRKNLEKINFSLPPFTEQLEIVARIEELFSELDKAVETLQKAKQQLAVYRQAVYQSVLSSYECVQYKLSDIVSTIEGDRGKNYPKREEFQKKGHCLFLTAQNVRQYGWQFNENTFISLEKDSVLRGGKLKRKRCCDYHTRNTGKCGYL